MINGKGFFSLSISVFLPFAVVKFHFFERNFVDFVLFPSSQSLKLANKQNYFYLS